MKKKIPTRVIDPYMMFAGYSFRMQGTEALMCCPCPNHKNRNEENAKFNIVSGEFICFGRCKTQYGKGYISRLIHWLRETCGIEALLHYTDSSFLPKAEERVELDWESLLSLPLAYNHPYLIGRGVTNNTVEKLNLHFDDRRIIMPNTDVNGKIDGVNIRYLTGKKIRYSVHGNKTHLFRLGDIVNYDRAKPLVICEGVFGMIKGLQYGYQTTCILGTGGIKDEQVLRGFQDVICGFDRDEAGLHMIERLNRRNKIPYWYAEPAEYDELDELGWERVLNNKTHSISKYKGLWYDKDEA